MPITTTNFIAGRMNKSVDERLLPPGEYIDAQNVRLGSTEATEIGAVENSKGNEQLTTLQFDGTNLSSTAVCIGAYEDGVRENIYWFIHDKNFTVKNGLDLIISYNTTTQIVNPSFKNPDDMPVYVSIYERPKKQLGRPKNSKTCKLPDEQKKERARLISQRYYANNH